jgi:hypothetical protein
MAKKKRRRSRRSSKQPKQIRTMDVILVVIAIALTAFTVEMIVIFRESGMIPDTLCTCVFAALGGECGAMAWIKTSKERHQDRKWIREDQERDEQLQNRTTENTTERTEEQ